MASQDLLLRVAKLSFEEGMSNKEIAEIFLRDGTLETETTAPRKVQQLIDEAGQWLLQEQARLAAMETAQTLEHKLALDLCNKFGLQAARVVPGGDIHAPFEYVALLKKYARAAADYFDNIASDAEEGGKQLYVSVSGGQPILDMVSALTERKRANVYFYAAASSNDRRGQRVRPQRVRGHLYIVCVGAGLQSRPSNHRNSFRRQRCLRP